MDFKEYQSRSCETVKDSIKGNISYFALGLCGEAGEVADKIKKGIRDGKLDVGDLGLELFDCVWYIAQLCECYGLDMEDLAKKNIAKLADRKKRGVIGGSGDFR